jgi:hypothetical protein
MFCDANKRSCDYHGVCSRRRAQRRLSRGRDFPLGGIAILFNNNVLRSSGIQTNARVETEFDVAVDFCGKG